MKFSQKFVSECREKSTYEKSVRAPLFRKSINLECKPEFAEIAICGLGFYDLYVNGKKITKGYLAPYISNTDHYTYFDKYDLVPYLVNGENVIGIMLGDGHQNEKVFIWNFNNCITNSSPKLALRTEIKCAEQSLIFEADSFVCKKGPIIFNDYRSGVFYDARLEENGWTEAGFVEKDWHEPILVERPRGNPKICEAEPIRVMRQIKPVKITKGKMCPHIINKQMEKYSEDLNTFEKPVPKDGGYIYDFGENNSGIFRLKIKGNPGQKINIQCAEQLVDGKVNYNNIKFYPDGYAQRDIYYLKGEGEEIFEPMFVYHGFRYLYVEGITDEQATPELLTYLVMSSALDEIGTFECSNDIVNKIYQMGRRSDISNFYYFPNDCPHREKNGWTGDASISSEHMIMNVRADESWREWLNNIRAAQMEDGKLPGIVPTDKWGYAWGNGPAWDSVIFNLPYYAYKYRGRTDLIEENAAAMLRYLEYVSKRRDERGIIEFGLGDWLPVSKLPNQYESELGFTDSVMVLDMCRKGVEMFDAIGLKLHKNFAEELSKEVLASIRKEYIDFDTFIVKNKCQTSQAMAIFFNVFTEEEKQNGFKVLMDILADDGYNFTSGFLGLRVIFHVLAQFGEFELAYKMITKKEFPSYGYWLDKGETTFLECFWEYDEYFQQSKNHHFLGDVVNWFMRYIGGLNVQNSSFVKVSPYFIKEIDWSKTTYDMTDGRIEISWQRKNKCIELTVKNEGNVQYDICIDDKYELKETGIGKYCINIE